MSIFPDNSELGEALLHDTWAAAKLFSAISSPSHYPDSVGCQLILLTCQQRTVRLPIAPNREQREQDTANTVRSENSVVH